MEKKIYSGIGGQAVLEGVMMKNKEKYAVAVRKSDGTIVVNTHDYEGIKVSKMWKELPFIRGTFNFIDSMILGTGALNESAEFYDEEETEQDKEGKFYQWLNKVSNGKAEKVISAIVTLLSIVLAVGIFMVLPYYISYLLKGLLANESWLAVLEGFVRIGIFIGYILLISLVKDIKRLFCYHGAEHKCINCLEHGMPLTVENVRKSSRQHKRCGTSFIFFVFLVSLVLFFFIRVSHPLARAGLRILLIPVVAGISYELIRLAGKSENIFVKILSAPGMFVQLLTTKEPDDEMIEVAIASVEAVYDWKAFLKENFDVEC